MNKLGNAFVAALKGSIEARFAVLKTLPAAPIDPPQKALGLFNAYYALTDILCDPDLRIFSSHPHISPLVVTMKQIKPVARLLVTVGVIPHLRFEGRKELARDEIKLFAQTLSRARDAGYINQEAIDAAYATLEQKKDPAFQTHKGALRS